MAASLLACGIDHKKSILFQQSAVIDYSLLLHIGYTVPQKLTPTECCHWLLSLTAWWIHGAPKTDPNSVLSLTVVSREWHGNEFHPHPHYSFSVPIGAAPIPIGSSPSPPHPRRTVPIPSPSPSSCHPHLHLYISSCCSYFAVFCDDDWRLYCIVEKYRLKWYSKTNSVKSTINIILLNRIW